MVISYSLSFKEVKKKQRRDGFRMHSMYLNFDSQE